MCAFQRIQLLLLHTWCDGQRSNRVQLCVLIYMLVLIFGQNPLSTTCKVFCPLIKSTATITNEFTYVSLSIYHFPTRIRPAPPSQLPFHPIPHYFPLKLQFDGCIHRSCQPCYSPVSISSSISSTLRNCYSTTDSSYSCTVSHSSAGSLEGTVTSTDDYPVQGTCALV